MSKVLVICNEKDEIMLKACRYIGLTLKANSQHKKYAKKTNVAEDNQKFIQQKMQGKRRTY
jgi:hypothetical protein